MTLFTSYYLQTWHCLPHIICKNDTVYLLLSANLTLFTSYYLQTWRCLPHIICKLDTVYLILSANMTLAALAFVSDTTWFNIRSGWNRNTFWFNFIQNQQSASVLLISVLFYSRIIASFSQLLLIVINLCKKNPIMLQL